MPFPEYSTRELWIEVARSAADQIANAEALDRFHVPMADVNAVIDAEAAGADEHGRSTSSPEDIATASGASPRNVRLIRAGLANSGLMSLASAASPWIQLQVPRGTSG